jgi:16S rRNA (uracil1498-N3)-methyltransferase
VVADLHTSAEVERRIPAASVALLLHEAAAEPLTDVMEALPRAGEVLIVVGPEGGLTDEELRGFASAGARALRLGPSVMRASTAGCAAAAVVLAATGRWI